MIVTEIYGVWGGYGETNVWGYGEVRRSRGSFRSLRTRKCVEFNDLDDRKDGVYGVRVGVDMEVGGVGVPSRMDVAKLPGSE